MKLMQKPRGNTLLLRRLSIARDLFEEILLMSKKDVWGLIYMKKHEVPFFCEAASVSASETHNAKYESSG